jgi:hypothetical protein
MPIGTNLTSFEIECPCCGGNLLVDPITRSVLKHQEKQKPLPIDDLAEAARRLKGESARREDLFQKSFQSQKGAADTLNRKFEELLRKAKEDPDDTPPIKPLI